jgi:predicted nucleic acid-binding protein
MSVVIDANLVAAIVLPVPYSNQATERIVAWKQAGVDLLAPLLLEYEVAAVLRRAIVVQWLTNEVAVEALGQILALSIQCLPPTPLLHEQALRWAHRLGHIKTYDAHYVALAEQTGSELWTADRRLASGARQAGVSWVRWVGQVEAVE